MSKSGVEAGSAASGSHDTQRDEQAAQDASVAGDANRSRSDELNSRIFGLSAEDIAELLAATRNLEGPSKQETVSVSKKALAALLLTPAVAGPFGASLPPALATIYASHAQIEAERESLRSDNERANGEFLLGGGWRVNPEVSESEQRAQRDAAIRLASDVVSAAAARFGVHDLDVGARRNLMAWILVGNLSPDEAAAALATDVLETTQVATEAHEKGAMGQFLRLVKIQALKLPRDSGSAERPEIGGATVRGAIESRDAATEARKRLDR